MLVMLRNEAPDSTIKEIVVFSNDTSTMFIKVLNDAVSDTTKDDSSNVVGYINQLFLKELIVKKSFTNLSSPPQAEGREPFIVFT